MKIISTNKTKIFITNIFIYLAIILLLTNSKNVYMYITNSLNMFIKTFVPSLYIYLLITEILINSNLVYNLSFGLSNILSKIFRIPKDTTFVILISILLGYPNAAKCIAKLYEDNIISLPLARKLISFTNNASPSYILCAIGISIFNSMSIGIILLISHFLSSIIIGICYPYSQHIIQQKVPISNSFYKISSPFDILLTSMLNSFKTLGIILGYLIIFSLIPNLILTHLPTSELLKGIAIGLFELTTGLQAISSVQINTTTLILLASFILSFSSLMIIFQVYSFVYKIGIKLKEIILYKLLHGVISTIITYVILKLNIFTISQDIPASLNLNVFQTNPYILPSLYVYIILSTIVVLYLTLKKKR